MARLSPNPRDIRPGPFPAAPEPATGPRAILWVGIGVGAVLLLVVAGVIFRLSARPKRGPIGNVPANFFQQASADFAEARRLLSEGRLSDSAEKFSDALHHRSRAGDRSVSAVQNFETWCAAREKEYRAAAAAIAPSLPEHVAAKKLSVAEVDTFLERFGTDDARAAWQQQRPGLERGAAATAAAAAYRVEWVIHDEQGNSIQDLAAGDFTPLADAISAKLGGTPLLAESAAPGIAPDAWRGYVGVTLVYAEAAYKETGVLGREAELKVPALLSARIEVITNQKQGRWDGIHPYIARVSPPAKLKDNEISGARVNLQRALLAKVVEQVSSSSAAPARPAAGSAPRTNP
jgi:hypothetical protein